MASAFAVVFTLLTPPIAAHAATDTEPSFMLIEQDLEFILKQIQISEAHAAGGDLLCESPTDTSGKCVPDPALPYGLRTVDGSFNNLVEGRKDYGAADQPFPRLVEPEWSDADSVPEGPGWPSNSAVPGATDMCEAGSTCYEMTAPNSFVYDAEPRVISNLIVDQTVNNPAAINAGDNTEGSETVGGKIFIPNTAPDEGLSAPTNTFFTFFGQFFDHGLDLVQKGGNGTLVVPLQPDDPLYDVTPPNQRFLTLSRATRINGDSGEHTNLTTPWIDQNQTYSSHPSHQVFLREFVLADHDGNAATPDAPVETGKLIEGEQGGMATWNDVKRQAREVFGIALGGPAVVEVGELGGDYPDVTNVPMLATDLYGNFLPGENGFPVLVEVGGGLVEGDITDPIPTTNAERTNHAFLDDIAHGASLDPRDLTAYDNVLLGEHFVAGDGRVNENVGLTAVHHVFHAEHNRLVDDIRDRILAAPGNEELEKAFMGLSHDYEPLMGQELPQPEDDDWSYTQRLFQAAKFATEMQYQHLVFEEFARKVQPQVDPVVFNENSYSPDNDPAIAAEFAHVVYRFGHSMLTEDIARSGFGSESLSLLDGFLNPNSFYENGALTPEQAAGSIINGTTNQVANQIDEHVIDTLRNELLGLPLDLATINILRARDTGTPSLQDARREFFDRTGDALLAPYTSWYDFGLGLKNGNIFGRGGSNASLVNFVAAYGTHPTVLAETTIDGKRNAAHILVNGVASGDAFITRLGGANRFDTAALVSKSQFAPNVPVVYIANGTNFPDALAGGPAAAADNGPILLTTASGIPKETAAELLRLNPQRIVVLGGSGVVSNAVFNTLGSYTDGVVTRYSGANRFATAAAISNATFSPGVDTVYIANGYGFPDALSGAAVAARDGSPMLLVQTNQLPSATATELNRLNPGRIVVLGGTGVVSTAVMNSLGAYTEGSVTRLGGGNRYETSAAISAASNPGVVAEAFVATGANFPDALAAAPVTGLSSAPLLLVPPTGIPTVVMDELDRLNMGHLTILGGTGVVPVETELLLATLAPPAEFDGPEDRLQFLHSTGGWASNAGGTTTGLDDVDFWTGGLAEALEPFGGMLGSTFNYVFENQLEDLQFNDRFYYLFRNQGNQLFAALEANSFSKLIQRNTDASLLPADIFAIQDPYIDLEALSSPLPEGLVLVNGRYRWDGDEHIEIHGNRTVADNIGGGQGDDALWGYGGADRIEGGSGNDSIIGGPDNDILTDTFGDDNIKGGLGNDVINGGAGENLLLGSHGHDFFIGGSDNLSTTFAGTGRDIFSGGGGGERIFGGEEEDWLDGGAGADLVQGDNANQFQNNPDGGDDIVGGGAGNDDIEGEGGNDILLGLPNGVDRHEGMSGFDWVNYQDSSLPVNIDFRFTTLQLPDVQAVRDRYESVEAASGSPHNDIIRGINVSPDDITDAQIAQNKMTEEWLDRILGLQDLLRPGGPHDDYSERFFDAPVLADFDGVSNLLLGGAGSDTIEGRGGNDFLDGDAYLRVQLEANGVRYDSPFQLRALVLNGSLDPGDITIVREILDDDAPGTVDTAVYGQSHLQYTIEPLEDGYFRISHTGVQELEESDGEDIIRNFEMLEFSDGCIDLETLELCETFGSVGYTGQFDPPTEDQPLTATVTIDDTILNPTDIRFTWQFAEGADGVAAEEWDNAIEATNVLSNVDGDPFSHTFTPGDEHAETILRVLVSFLDDDGTRRVIAAEPTFDGVVAVPDPVDPLPILSITAGPSGRSLTLPIWADGDGYETAFGGDEATITYLWERASNVSGLPGDDWTEVPQATPGRSYGITPADNGMWVRVTVSYVDDQGWNEVFTVSPIFVQAVP